MKARLPAAASALALALATVGLAACRSSESAKASGPAASASAAGGEGTTAPAPSAAAPAKPVEAAPGAVSIPRERLDAVLNPRGAAPYEGPVGVVEGTVVIRGAQAPKLDVAIPRGCGDALASYTKLFREGTGRTLADALVTVTEYEGYVPAKREAKVVPIRGCAFDTRTVSLTFGERIEVANRDAKMSYLPQLVGGRHPVDMVAVPKGDPVKLYPTEVGHYALADGMARRWMHADVYVLKYPTHDVTGLDGKFRIEGVPVGKARVTAYLPAIDESVEREIEVKAGEPVSLELVLEYAAKKGEAKKAAAEKR